MLRILLGFLAVGALLVFWDPAFAPAGGSPLSATGEPYVGAARCGACHAAAVAKWRKGPHRRAYESLPAARRRDSRCLTCHSPDPAGVWRGVQCESCHGAGRHYSYGFVMKDRRLARWLGMKRGGESTCKRCHEAGASSRAFDYEAKKRAIDHWSR